MVILSVCFLWQVRKVHYSNPRTQVVDYLHGMGCENERERGRLSEGRGGGGGGEEINLYTPK